MNNNNNNYPKALFIGAILTVLSSLITYVLTRYYVIKNELATNSYLDTNTNVFPYSGIITDTLEVYTFNNIYFIDFVNMKVFNEMSNEEVKFSSLEHLFDYIGDVTAHESSVGSLISTVVQNSWIKIDSSQQLTFNTKFGADPNNGMYVNKFSLYKSNTKYGKLYDPENVNYLPE